VRPKSDVLLIVLRPRTHSRKFDVNTDLVFGLDSMAWLFVPVL